MLNNRLINVVNGKIDLSHILNKLFEKLRYLVSLETSGHFSYAEGY